MKKTIFTLVILLLGFNCLLAQLSGNGTANDPWLISSTADLSTLSANSTYWNGHIKQTADIDAPAGSFSPIGNNTSRFNGSYDGDEHTIDGLYIYSLGWYIGLFGKVSYPAIISNLGVINVNISANRYVGGLVGNNSGGTVSNCYSTGSVNGSYLVGGLAGSNGNGTITECYSTSSVNGYAYAQYVGGLVGQNGGIGTVSKCYSTGSVNGYSEVGGLVGENYRGTVSNCYSTGSVIGFANVGGLVGRSLYGTVTECYSTSSVNGSYLVGGLVGGNSGSSCTVINCYSTGSVNGGIPGSYVGGLVGRNLDGSTVSSSFWDTQTSGQSTSAGGTGKTTSQMQTQSTFTSAGWNFTTVWQIIGTNYPVFKVYSSPQEKIGMLIATIDLMKNAGILNTGNANSLKSKLNAALDKISQGKINAAINILNAFKNQINALVNSNKLTPAQGEALVERTDALIEQISGENIQHIVQIPKEFKLDQNYPNPFNPITRIDYSLPFDSKVSLQIFDVLGREVVTLVNENQRAGYYSIDFNASKLASGIYYYRMITGDFKAIKKMVLIK